MSAAPIREPELIPELVMWRAVIATAFNDAASPAHSLLKERDEAREWLTKNSRDFRLVCTLASLDSDAVRENALEREAQGWPLLRGD